MEWYVSFSVIIIMLLVALATGMPVVFSFLLVNFIILYVVAGGAAGFSMVVNNGQAMLTSEFMAPVILFLLLGVTFFRSGMASRGISSLDRWIGRLPGRLSAVCLVSGGVIGAVSGSGIAMAALLSGSMAPVMRQRNYSLPMTLGPIMGGAVIDNLIPPSVFAVFLGGIAKVSIGRLLIGIIGPGILLATLCIAYVVCRAIILPSEAPADRTTYTFRERAAALPDLIPILFIIVAVTGVIFLGIATPTEAAATGAFGSFILAAAYGRLSPGLVRQAAMETVKTATALMLIAFASSVFSNVLAYTGSTTGLANAIEKLALPNSLILISMLTVAFILGCFIDGFSIILITIPVFMPLAKSLGFDPIWFCILYIISLVVGGITPPFALILFTIKGLMPEVPTKEIYKATIPYIAMSIFVMACVMIFPIIATGLVSLMRY